uniref:Macaca fascicularis brain cDNA clone: QflA-22208, similar to human 3'(2'), 5'-bisphosphate nucleotidase 1 (BPNT1), mRNA, RefSeq: NM_006085.3 n=1 Tax=Macaca fascicularis TaxID=9541 RepID=I7GMH5_MACFA|nr:unnamed protein product [Macaca fascicularis]
MCTAYRDFLPKGALWKRGIQKNDFIVDKHGKHYPRQEIQVNISSDVMLIRCVLDIMGCKWHFSSAFVIPKTYDPILIMRKIYDKCQLKDIVQDI